MRFQKCMERRKKEWYIAVLFLLLGIMLFVWSIFSTEGDAEIQFIEIGNKIQKDATNPYSTETSSGLYLYDIFEANRGGYESTPIFENSDLISYGDWFAKKGFSYYREFDPYQDYNYHMVWSIHLAEMKGASLLSTEFNKYHKLMYHREKEAMIEAENEAKRLFFENGEEEFNFYSRNIYTAASYYWGNIFVVVDIKNTHHVNGCSVETVNFDVITGKKYQLADLFTIEDYKEWLREKIEERYPFENYIVNSWSDCLNTEEISFLIAYSGLVLIDNFEQRTLLICWEEMEDVLSNQIKSALAENTCGDVNIL